MRCSGLPFGTAFLVGGLLAAGCEQTSQSRAYPPDPLLQCSKPVEGKSKDSTAVSLAHNEPAVPTLGDESAWAQAQPDAPDAQAKVESSNKLQVKAEPVSRRKTPPLNDLFGHAEDFRWLIGGLESNDKGSLCLRFASAPADDRWGGTITLTSPESLARFQIGDLLFLEGELAAAPNPDTSQPAPAYCIRSVKLLRKGN
jgi:hypothetical protein